MSPGLPPGCEHYDQRQAPVEMGADVRDFAFRFGETFVAYLVTEEGWETFWSPDRRGLIRFVRWGRYAFSVGGLLAAPRDQPELLRLFLQFIQARGWMMTFYNIGRDRLSLFRDQDCQATKCGEEPIVRLDRANWKGKELEWVRRQENYCKRQGVRVHEVTPNPDDPVYRDTVAPELAAISREHVANTLHGRELRYVVGQFKPLAMGHQRLFIARSPERIEGFVVCNPCLAGRMWAIEMYRRRTDAPRGVIPFAMVQTMRQLQEEGIAYCSLSATPALRCENILAGDSWAARGAYVYWWRYFNWLYDVRGIYHFKSRFRPDYREMYLVSWPQTTILSLIGVGMVWGVFWFNPWKLLTDMVTQTRSRAARKSLAEPRFRPSRVLRRLMFPLSDSPARGDEAGLSPEASPRTPESRLEESP
jgi:phosphatidylglycerol lysyltransferase